MVLSLVVCQLLMEENFPHLLLLRIYRDDSAQGLVSSVRNCAKQYSLHLIRWEDIPFYGLRDIQEHLASSQMGFKAV